MVLPVGWAKLPSHAARLTDRHSRCEQDSGRDLPARGANLSHEIWSSSVCPLCPQQILLFMLFLLQGMKWVESQSAGKETLNFPWHQIWVWTLSQLNDWGTISSLILSFPAFSCHLDNAYSKSASRPSSVSMTTWTSAQLHLSPYPPMACSSLPQSLR